ncbi:MAG: hypothetical protein ACFB9M_09810 [Myxococcota bacterium]
MHARRCLEASLLLLVLNLSSAIDAYALTVPAGTELLVRTNQTVDSKRMNSGSQFTVTLEGNLNVGGTVAVPSGSTAYGTLVDAKKSARVVGQSQIVVSLTRIKVGGNLISIRTSGVKAAGEKKGRKTAGKAARGALIGAMFGGGKGAAMGAAAGASAQLLLGGSQVSIPANTLLEFTLADPLVIPGAEPPKAQAEASSDPTDLVLAIAKARSEDLDAMQTYTWQQRTEVKHAGKTLLVRLEVLRFDFDGDLQRTTMSEDPNNLGSKQSYLDRLPELRGYLLPSAGDLVDFMQKATVDSSGNPVTARATGVLEPGDSIEVKIDKGSSRLSRMDVSAKLDRDPVNAVIEFRTLKEGIGYPARAIVKIPSQQLDITIENFNYNSQ